MSERLTKGKREELERSGREYLSQILKPGSVIHTSLKHVSRSGMQRSIGLYVTTADGDIRNITKVAARVMGNRYDEGRDGILIGGVGMDMGFALVYNLGHSMWPGKVRCTGQWDTCYSNDHSNSGPNRDRYDGRTWHRDSGYALKQRWL